MVKCSNCGTILPDGSVFCMECGMPINNEEVHFSKREQEFAGKIIKCPSCGMDIPSFTAICPGCGHEINSTRVGSAVSEFSNLINQSDHAIAHSPAAPKKGWNSWSSDKQKGWVLLNFVTFCIPLLIYLLLPLFGIGGMSSLTAAEQKKANLINNYVFPNDRANILEGLIYIKSQIEALVSGKITTRTHYWVKIWKNKASQLFEKAEMLFRGDKIAKDTYEGILANVKKVKIVLLIKIVIVIAIVITCIVFAIILLRYLGTTIASYRDYFYPY